MLEVALTTHELYMAASIGMMRHIAALKRGLPDRHGAANSNGWQLHIEGACGELALAKALDLYWDGSVNTFKGSGDVARYQVRTRSKHDYDLIVRTSDDQEALYWLVTGVTPAFIVRGWIRGSDARQACWWQTHGGREGAWFVPQSSLKLAPFL